MTDYTIIRKLQPSVSNLESYLEGCDFATKKGDKLTNIINQYNGKTYAFPLTGSGFASTSNHFIAEEKVTEPIERFFCMIEQCRTAGVSLYFAERQYFDISGGSIDKSCIEYDFDIYLAKKVEINPDMFSGILDVFSEIIAKNIDWDSNPDAEIVKKSQVSFHALIMRKEQRKVNSERYGECWKESFHIRVYIKISKYFKAYIRKLMLENDYFKSLFSPLEMLCSLEEAFDRNSIAFPAMIYGNRKRGGAVPHKLETLYKVSFVRGRRSHSIVLVNDFAPIKETVKKGKETYILTKYAHNLCYELSLNFEVPNGVIKKCEFEPVSSIIHDISSYNDRQKHNVLSVNDIADINKDVTFLTVIDFEANYLKHILDIINLKRISTYETWRTIVLALARANIKYKPLAIYFSSRCPVQFTRGGVEKINEFFDLISENRLPPDGRRPITIRTLYRWAAEDNPEEYAKIQEFNMFKKLKDILFKTEGKLNDLQVAELLKCMFGSKFVCDEDPRVVQKKLVDRKWREFVFPVDYHAPGELYKWRLSGDPDSLRLFIGKKFPEYLELVINFCKEKMENIGNDDHKTPEQKARELKYYDIVKKGTSRTQHKLGNIGPCEAILKQCRLVFRGSNYGFEGRMDTDPNYLGVVNGVLKLYPNTELIQHYHEVPISKSARVAYVKYDKSSKYVQDLEREILEIFANDQETYEFFMMLLASGLDAREKNPQYLVIWYGDGAQGKTVLSELDQNTLGIALERGGGYSSKMDVSWFCSGRNASGADPAIMSARYARKIWCAETRSNDTLHMDKVKEVLSEKISSRGLYVDQSIFKINAHIIMSTNNKPRITGRDWGTWRRIIYYKLKRYFYDVTDSRYDPSDKNHKIKKPEIIDKWVLDRRYQEAYLSILVYWYEVLRDKYGGYLSRVPKSTINKETEEYAKEQDTITQFICDRIIHTSANEELVGINDIVNKYIAWHAHVCGGKVLANKKEIANDFTNHPKIKNYLTKTHSSYNLVQHKVLDLHQNYSDIANAIKPTEVAAGVGEAFGLDFSEFPEESVVSLS